MLTIPFLLTLISPAFCSDLRSLPYCPGNYDSSLILVSTLDGKLSALNINGSLIWTLDTGPGPLLSSNIHHQELTNNGEWIRIIPSLTGMLYKFDGYTVDPIPISAEDLLKSSFLYSSDLVVAGGSEVRTYGIGFRTGTVFYECSSVKCSNNEDNDDDILLVERSNHLVRAVEPQSGQERWNFSVGLHNIKLPSVSCTNPGSELNWKLSTVVPEGKVQVSFGGTDLDHWNYVFPSPLVRVWKWTGKDLSEVNTFKHREALQVSDNSGMPALYLGMHLKQLYIYESPDLLSQVKEILSGELKSDVIVTNSLSTVKIPWRPIPASKETIEEDSTAVSILNASEYVNGHGFYLFRENKSSNVILCGLNNTLNKSSAFGKTVVQDLLFGYLSSWWKETLLFISTSVIFHLLFCYWNQRQELTIVEKPLPATIFQPPEDKQNRFVSRFESDFETERCLGKGGFGVVFEVKQKIDECKYAIKRITLPDEMESRDRVMREVKALAKLEHQNIVRYFCSWVERPPAGWKQKHDEKWIDEKCYAGLPTDTFNVKAKRSKSLSVSIDIQSRNSDLEIPIFDNADDDDDDDSFIVFENTSDGQNNCSIGNDFCDVNASNNTGILLQNSNLDNGSLSDHLKKKVNWRRPDRKHYSWDLTTTKDMVPKVQEPPVYLYIQMQLCQKESLKEWLGSHIERDFKTVLDIFLQILEAVEYVHLRGLIHRDLKPSNIFFSLDGQIKVGDFGLVKDAEDAFDMKFIKKGVAYHGHTLEVGTQLYMSPEQFKSRIYDYKVDIYSLGLIFLELLVPFATEMEKIKTFNNVKNNNYPSEFRERFQDEYKLVHNMLSEDPNKRLTTIGIKARPPFNVQDFNHDEDCHYRLNSFTKTLSY